MIELLKIVGVLLLISVFLVAVLYRLLPKNFFQPYRYDKHYPYRRYCANCLQRCKKLKSYNDTRYEEINFEE